MSPQTPDAFLVLGQLDRIAGIQRIGASTRVCVDDHERLVLLTEITRQLNENQVFEYVGMIAGVESVTITEHVRRRFE